MLQWLGCLHDISELSGFNFNVTSDSKFLVISYLEGGRWWWLFQLLGLCSPHWWSIEAWNSAFGLAQAHTLKALGIEQVGGSSLLVLLHLFLCASLCLTFKSVNISRKNFPHQNNQVLLLVFHELFEVLLHIQLKFWKENQVHLMK